MGIIKRQASKATITSLLGLGVSSASALLIIPMIPQEVYGTVSIVIGIASILLPFTLLGLNSTLLRFSESFNQNRRESFFKKLYKFHTIYSVLFCIIFYICSEWFLLTFYTNSPSILNSGLVISVLIFFMGQFTMFSAYATSKYRINITRIIELIFQKAGLPLLLLLNVLEVIPLELILPGIVVLYFLRLFSIWFFKKTQLAVSENHKSVELNKKEIISYSAFAFIAVLMHQAIIDIDTLMVGSLINVSEAGVYKYAFYLALIVDLPRLNLVTLLFPLLTKFQNARDHRGIDDVYKRSSNLLFILGSFIVIIIIPNLDDYFRIIPNGTQFIHSKSVIILIAFSKLVNMMMGINFEIIASSNKYYVLLFINLITVIFVIILNKLFISIWGISGAALATFVVWTLYNFISFVYLRFTRQLSPFSITTLKILSSLIIFLLFLFYFPLDLNSPFVNISVRLCFSSLFLFLCYKLKLSHDLNDQIDKLLSKLKR